jgi:hypothetical protein
MMLRTPVKSSASILISDFENTRSFSKEPRTHLKHEQKLRLYDMPTPKKHDSYAGLKDRALRKNEFLALKNNRAKLIDWYLEIFAHYKLGWECFWMTVELVDLLIADFNYVELNNIEIVAIVSCFITAKLLGKKNLRLECIYIGLGHSKFTKAELLKEEQNILKIIFEKSNFERKNIYSYMMDKYS